MWGAAGPPACQKGSSTSVSWDGVVKKTNRKAFQSMGMIAENLRSPTK